MLANRSLCPREKPRQWIVNEVDEAEVGEEDAVIGNSGLKKKKLRTLVTLTEVTPTDARPCVKPEQVQRNPRIPPRSYSIHSRSLRLVFSILTAIEEAFVHDDFELAVELYTQEIEVGSAIAQLYPDHAKAHIKLGNYTGMCLPPSLSPSPAPRGPIRLLAQCRGAVW